MSRLPLRKPTVESDQGPIVTAIWLATGDPAEAG
jgi:hypothetical protein